jgi:hypothetical protein
MTSDEQRMREIEQGERWFREVCAEPEPPDTNRIKRRVQLAVNEQWLGDQPNGQPPADLADRTKRRVWAAVAAERTARAGLRVPHGGTRLGRRFYQWAGGLGVAAAACLLAFFGLREPLATTEEPTFTLLEAFEAFQEDELADSLAALEDDLTELELAVDTLSFISDDEEMFDDLLDTVDDLMREGETDQSETDWS